MLICSRFYYLVMIQIVISGSQSKPQATTSEDPEFCQYLDNDQCFDESIKVKCINRCEPKLTDADFCIHIRPEKCSEDFIKTECPQTCSTPDQGGECPGPWVTVGQDCFLIIHEESERSWSEARTYCRSQATGADLAQPADIRGLADFLAANGYPIQSSHSYWLGGSDLAVLGSWRWLNGTVLPKDQANWGPGQPSGRAGYDCLNMFSALDAAKSLYNGNCTYETHFICDRP